MICPLGGLLPFGPLALGNFLLLKGIHPNGEVVHTLQNQKGRDLLSHLLSKGFVLEELLACLVGLRLVRRVGVARHLGVQGHVQILNSVRQHVVKGVLFVQNPHHRKGSLEIRGHLESQPHDRMFSILS